MAASGNTTETVTEQTKTPPWVLMLLSVARETIWTHGRGNESHVSDIACQVCLSKDHYRLLKNVSKRYQNNNSQQTELQLHFGIIFEFLCL